MMDCRTRLRMDDPAEMFHKTLQFLKTGDGKGEGTEKGTEVVD